MTIGTTLEEIESLVETMDAFQQTLVLLMCVLIQVNRPALAMELANLRLTEGDFEPALPLMETWDRAERVLGDGEFQIWRKLMFRTLAVGDSETADHLQLCLEARLAN